MQVEPRDSRREDGGHGYQPFGAQGTDSAYPAQTVLFGTPELAVFLATTLFYGWISLNRLIDRDEGFYLLAAREVMRGRSLYHDFFFPQMPLLPWFYGLVMKIIGFGWAEARGITALLAAAIATLLFGRLRALTSTAWALAGVTLFCTANFALPWFVVAKTYTLSTLLLLIAVLLASIHSARATPWQIWLCGVTAALATQTRLFFAPIGVLLLAAMLLRATREQRLRTITFFSLGVLIGSLPALYYLVLGWDNFFFNNLGYHLGRSAHSDEVKLNQKIFVSKILFGFAPPGRDLGLHAPLLLYSFVAAVFFQILRKKWPPLTAWVTLALFCLSLLPSPTYLQYFAVVAPFLILTIIPSARDLARHVYAYRLTFGHAVVLAFLGLFAWWSSIVPQEVRRFASTGEMMIGIPAGDAARQWSIEAAEHVAAAVDRQTTAGEQVMTLWPGYLLSSHASVYPRFENHFGFSASQQVPRAEQRQFALPSEWYVKNEISNRPARVVLTHPRLGPGYVGEALRSHGYRIVEEVEGVRIWLRQEQVGDHG